MSDMKETTMMFHSGIAMTASFSYIARASMAAPTALARSKALACFSGGLPTSLPPNPKPVTPRPSPRMAHSAVIIPSSGLTSRAISIVRVIVTPSASFAHSRARLMAAN